MSGCGFFLDGMVSCLQCALKIAAHLNQGPGRRRLPHSLPATRSLRSDVDLESMDAKAKQSKRREGVLSSLNVIIEGLNIAEKASSITPAKAVFSTVSVILTMIRVCFLLLFRD